MAGTHIRPKVRRNKVESSAAATTASGSPPLAKNNAVVTFPSGTEEQPLTTLPESTSTSNNSNPQKGILRKPKYGGGGSGVADVAAATINTDLGRPLFTRGALEDEEEEDYTEEETAFMKSSNPPPAVVQNKVVERPRQKRNKTKKTKGIPLPPNHNNEKSTSIEGYTPRQEGITYSNNSKPTGTATAAEVSGRSSEHKEDNNCASPNAGTGATTKEPSKEEETIILSSLSDLLETSGVTLPPKDTPLTEASVVEADLQFSVMAPEQYEELKEEEREEQYEVFMGQPSVFQEDDETDKENSVEDPEDDDDNPLGSDDDENDDDVHALADNYFDDSDDEDNEVAPPEPRAFIKLWGALSHWITPQAVAYVKALRSPSTNLNELGIQSAVDRSDLGASRCAGLMTTIQLHFRSVLEELGHDLEERRMIERRVGDLLRTFDYSRPSPRLDMTHTKAMAAILMRTVLYNPQDATTNPASEPLTVPPCCQKVGLTLDEFRYLTVSAITNLATS